MKEISLSRILRWTLASFIVSFAIALIFNVGIASAETGTLTIDANAGNSYTAEHLTASAGVFDFTKFGFDSTDYNYLSKIQILNTRGTFSISGASTAFTITVGGTGTGTLSFDKNTNTITWFFNNAHITSSPVTLSYDSNILALYLTQTAGCTQTGASVSSTEPVKFFGTTSGAMADQSSNAGLCGASQTFIVQSTMRFSNNYNVVYNNGLANVSIDKSISTVNSKIQIKNSTTQKFIETTFNTVSFSYVFQYDNGLYLNMSDSSGNYDIVLVNSSGVSVVPPIVPGGGGSSSGQIYFDFTNATPGAVYGINASITGANFSYFNTYYIDVFDPTGTEIFGFPASFGIQNYSTGRFYYFNKFGTYTANLSYCSFINPLCPSVFSPTMLDTASLTINQIALSYNISTDKPNYQQGDTIYINATNPGLTNTYVTATGTTGIITELAWNAQVDPNSVRVIVGTIPNTLPLGTYFVSLAGSQGYNPILAQARFNITANTPDNVLGIGWNDYLYTVGATGILTYKSNMNLSTVTIYRQGNSNEVIVSVKSFSVPAGNITGNYSQIFNSPGNWYAYIVDSVNNSNFKWANTSVLNPNPSDPNAQTLCKSKESYVCWDKHEYTQGDAYIINYKLVVPSVITYFPTINIYDPDDKVVRTIKLNYSIWNNTITGAISGKFGTTSKIGIWFVRAEKINQVTAENNGEIANSATSVIGRNASTVPTSTVPSGSSAVSSFGSNLLSFMSMPAFWGLFIFIGAIFWVSRSRGASGDLGIVAFILANLEAVIGLWSPFTWYILIVSWVIAGIYFTVGRKAVTQN